MTQKKYLIAGLVTIIILGPFCVSMATKHRHKDTTIKISQPAIPVEATKVTATNIPNQVHSLGSLYADQSVTISSEVDGRVHKLFFQDGQQVAQGMPIIQLDNAKDQANYDSVTAALNVARNKYNRAQKLWNEGAVSKQDLEQLKADVETKSADVKSAQVALQQKELTAPFSGTLGAFNTQEGDFISKGNALVTLVNTKELKVKYTLPEVLRPQLQRNQQVAITTAAYPNKKFYGTVTFIAPAVDVATRSIGIHAEINNDQGLLAPGMFVQVTQSINVQKGALVIPEQAIIADVSGYTIFVIRDGKAHKTNIKLGARVAGMAQVLNGLQLGDLVVTAGQQKLSDNDTVQIINNQQ
ncbi:MAG: efflux RND transporter periplasmic adaptor subunit [Gammaproteobacteria bacterium]|nr:efflux RND transporter periplasmic adaptor subunit [Gammaproteobacteria bacterium]